MYLHFKVFYFGSRQISSYKCISICINFIYNLISLQFTVKSAQILCLCLNCAWAPKWRKRIRLEMSLFASNYLRTYQFLHQIYSLFTSKKYITHLFTNQKQYNFICAFSSFPFVPNLHVIKRCKNTMKMSWFCIYIFISVYFIGLCMFVVCACIWSTR